ncbi:MAG TPA: hypothetical protein DDY75_16790 [Sphingobacterium sp.]|nr:hypothetical protein BV902_22680 [Sphingobacterium sp. B29]HBI89495.1 hypothetical protein [Sphingobacterium sp.]
MQGKCQLLKVSKITNLFSRIGKKGRLNKIYLPFVGEIGIIIVILECERAPMAVFKFKEINRMLFYRCRNDHK